MEVVFLNSSHDEKSGAHFIGTSLELMQNECPPAFTRLCRQMVGRKVVLEIAGEQIYLVFERDRVLLDKPAKADKAVQLRTNWRVILALIDAEMTMVDAILSGEFDLYGESSELALFYDATMTYFRGAVRCPSFPALLDRLRLVKSS